MVHPCDAARETARARLGSHSVCAQPVTVALALALADARSDRVADAEVRAAQAPHSIMRVRPHHAWRWRPSRPHPSLLCCAWNVRRRATLDFALSQPDDAQPDDAQPDDALAHVRLRWGTRASARSRAGTLYAYSHSEAVGGCGPWRRLRIVRSSEACLSDSRDRRVAC